VPNSFSGLVPSRYSNVGYLSPSNYVPPPAAPETPANAITDFDAAAITDFDGQVITDF
jgi:hypothetical protein